MNESEGPWPMPEKCTQCAHLQKQLDDEYNEAASPVAAHWILLILGILLFLEPAQGPIAHLTAMLLVALGSITAIASYWRDKEEAGCEDGWEDSWEKKETL